MTVTRIDCHVKILDQTVVERAKTRGIDVLVYAPHFTPLPEIEASADRYSDDEITVIPAREIFTGGWGERRHVLAMNLTDPIPDFLSLEATMVELERQAAVVLIPHPTFFTVSFGAEEIERYHSLIDAIETYNPKHLPRHNRRARELSLRFDRPEFGSSYAHLRGSIGEVWTAFDLPNQRPETILDAFREHEQRRVHHRPGLSHRIQCSLEFSHLFWENTGKKLHRLTLGGLEPTHPDQPMYHGRFDQDTVYQVD